MVPESNNKVRQRVSKQAEWEGRAWYGKRKVWTVPHNHRVPKKSAAHRCMHRYEKKKAKTIAPSLNERVMDA